MSPQFTARMAGLFYLIVVLTGGLSLVLRGAWGLAAGVVAGVCYVVVTLLFYVLFTPVSRNLSLMAAVVSLLGCAVGPLRQFDLLPVRISPLVFFGIYCLLISYLIFRSWFVPRFLGVLMMIAGLGWLTFLSPVLAKSLSPYNLFPGIVGESALTLWLLIRGVDEQRWKEQASRALRAQETP